MRIHGGRGFTAPPFLLQAFSERLRLQTVLFRTSPHAECAFPANLVRTPALPDNRERRLCFSGHALSHTVLFRIRHIAECAFLEMMFCRMCFSGQFWPAQRPILSANAHSVRRAVRQCTVCLGGTPDFVRLCAIYLREAAIPFRQCTVCVNRGRQSG